MIFLIDNVNISKSKTNFTYTRLCKLQYIYNNVNKKNICIALSR